MNTVKKEVYDLLNVLGYTVLQSNPLDFESLPVITYNIADNAINVDLDKNIAYQDVNVNIDIWASDSVSASNILNEVEELLRSNSFIMSFSADIPNVDANLWHISARFTTII